MRLIDANAEIAKLDAQIADPRYADSMTELLAAKTVLLQALLHRQIDAVEVVRCKDCKNSSRIAIDTTDEMRHCWSGRGAQTGDGFSRVNPDGYCDEGERKEGEHG